jgi:phenylacetate-CoA ligase
MLEDTLRSVRHLYYKMPEWQKCVIGGMYRVLPDSLRLGRSFLEFSRLLKESEYWSADRLEEYQYEQIRSTLEQAYKHVPYYGRRFAEYGVSPSTFQKLTDIRRFPYLTKSDIQEHYKDLFADNVPKRKVLMTTTGGSTAEPLKFAQVKGLTRSKERAFIWEGWMRCGYWPGARCVQFKGRNVGQPELGIFWEYEPVQNYLEMDSNFLKSENIPAYLRAIQSFEAEFMIGYVSSVFILARYLNEHPKIRVPIFRAIFLASENVYTWQRDYIEKVFNCRVFSHYGHSEMVLLGMECEYHHALHFFPQYGLLEVVGSDDNQVLDVGGEGELVGTSFHNAVMPLIRYRTQDYGTIGAGKCECGRHYPILDDVQGRLQEFIVTSDKRLISICVMGAAHFDISGSVYESQYYQDRPGHVVFRVVPRENFNEADKSKILAILSGKARGGFTVEIQEVNKIKKSATGKHIMIEQRLPVDTYMDRFE